MIELECIKFLILHHKTHLIFLKCFVLYIKTFIYDTLTFNLSYTQNTFSAHLNDSQETKKKTRNRLKSNQKLQL